MKPFVLQNRRTGDLFEAYRVCLLDKEQLDWSSDISPSPTHRLSLEVIEQDGWIVVMPSGISPMPVFFNMHATTLFEVLGEL